MGKRGPPDKIAQTLKLMEEHDGRVNISQFAREFDVDRLKLSRLINNLSSEIHPSLIINCDETPAYVKNTPASANHFAYDDKSWQWVRASDRLKVTVLAACAADGTMLKPTIVSKGKTVQCERPYADMPRGTQDEARGRNAKSRTE